MEPGGHKVRKMNSRERLLVAYRGFEMESDLSYFARRAEEERRAATRAKLEVARQAHLDLASRYEDLGQAIVAHARQPARSHRLELVNPSLQG